MLRNARTNRRIKENAAKRIVGIRVSELYRRRKAALLNWARKFSRNELNRLINEGNNKYNRRINSIPNPPLSRTNMIKAVIARYLTMYYLNWPNAVQATRNIHNAYGRPVQNRIPNAQLVSFVMSLPTNRLNHLTHTMPFFV
jgi:hypothetical protein